MSARDDNAAAGSPAEASIHAPSQDRRQSNTGRIRALVMSAGFGTRLRPLTYSLPKPLLPVGNDPIAGHTLRRLNAVGCEAAALNLHHLGDTLRGYFGQSYCGLPLVYSSEEPILGTFGALAPLRRFLGRAEAVILVNGDSYCEWPFEAMLRRHRRNQADATLLVLRRQPDISLGGGIAVDKGGRVTGLRDYPTVGASHRRHIFAGAHILSPHLLDRAPEGFGDIVEDLYQPLLEEGGRIETVVTGRAWHDLGTPERYLDACLDHAGGSGWRRLLSLGGESSISALAEVEKGARLATSIVARGARIGSGAKLHDSLVLGDAEVGEGCELVRTILGPGAVLAPGSKVENRMVCRREPRHELGESESVMGDLIFTPL